MSKLKIVGIVLAGLLILGVIGNLVTPKHPAAPAAAKTSAPPTAAPATSAPPASAAPEWNPGTVAVSGTKTEQRLCAALDGPITTGRLQPLILAEENDAEAGISLGLDGTSLLLHLSMTNHAAKVAQDIQTMREHCNTQAG